MDLQTDQLCGHFRQGRDIAVGAPEFERDVAAKGIAEFPQPLGEFAGERIGGGIEIGRHQAENADPHGVAGWRRRRERN